MTALTVGGGSQIGHHKSHWAKLWSELTGNLCSRSRSNAEAVVETHWLSGHDGRESAEHPADGALLNIMVYQQWMLKELNPDWQTPKVPQG